MGFIEILILGIGLSMDAFAVSICKGLSLKNVKIKHLCIAGLWFGGFQALMPLTGYFLGSIFADKITKYDHWVAFILLVIIGINMIRESLSKNGTEEECCEDPKMDVKSMFLLAIATSIDALAVGVTFAFMHVNIIPAITIIGLTTFTISAAGVKIGSIFGTKFKSKAEIAGGIVLILIGLKILITG